MSVKRGERVECRFGRGEEYYGGEIVSRYRGQEDQHVVRFDDGARLVMLLTSGGEGVVWRRERELFVETEREEIVVRYALDGKREMYLRGECHRCEDGDYEVEYKPTVYFPRVTRDRLSRRQYEDCKRRVSEGCEVKEYECCVCCR